MEEDYWLIFTNMELKHLSEEIEIPDGVDVSLDNNILEIKGPKGSNKKDFTNFKVFLEKKEKKLKFTVDGVSRKSKDFLNSSISNFNNLVTGAKEGYVYKLKVCSGHFPMSVAIEKNKVIIKNFIGEKVPRVANIIDGVSVKINSDIIIVESSDKEKAGQVSANIETATRITNKDRRVFQDGVFIIEKAGEPVQ